MNTDKRTPISTLGEFGLIRHLTENIELQNASSKYGSSGWRTFNSVMIRPIWYPQSPR